MINNKDNWFVYILECKNGSYYTGIAKDVEKRLKMHIEGSGAKYTRANPPKGVIYSEKCVNMNAALKRESQIKKMSRKRKEKIVQTLNSV